MVNVAPRKMLAARGVIEFVAEKSILPIEEKMDQRSADSENPNPAAQRRILCLFRKLSRSGDYCTFFADDSSTIVADLV